MKKSILMTVQGISLVIFSFMLSMPVLAAASVTDELARADTLFIQRADPQTSLESLDLLEKVIHADPGNPEAHWKAARAAWWAGTLLEKRSERLSAFRRGKGVGAAAVARNPRSVEAHFWLGANYASFGHVNGILSSLFALPTIRRTMEQVLLLDDHYMGGGAYRILGIIDYRLPGWAGGNRDRAIKRLMASHEIAPNNPVTLFYLADFYRSQGDRLQAKAWMKRFQEQPADADFELEKRILIKEERKTIAELGD